MADRFLSQDSRDSLASEISHSEEALLWLGRVMVLGAGVAVVFAASSLFPLSASSATHFAQNIGVALLIAGASALVGGLIGFLFGVPRTLQGSDDVATARADDERPQADGTREARYRPNTNLEQISDWLTKILVGVGLTQLTELPKHLQSLSAFLATGFQGILRPQVLAGSVVVYFSISGFIFTYLWARLFLAGELREADLRSVVQRVDRKVTLLEAQAARDARALALAQQQLNPQGQETEVEEKALAEAIQSASPAVKTALLNQAWDVRKKTWETDKPAMERTIPILRALAANEKIDHMPHAQLGFALKDQRHPDWEAARESLARAISYRGDWKGTGWILYEWNRAFCNIQIDLARGGSAPTPGEERESILADLRAAFTADALVDWTRREETMMQWLQRNQIQIESLASG